MRPRLAGASEGQSVGPLSASRDNNWEDWAKRTPHAPPPPPGSGCPLARAFCTRKQVLKKRGSSGGLEVTPCQRKRLQSDPQETPQEQVRGKEHEEHKEPGSQGPPPCRHGTKVVVKNHHFYECQEGGAQGGEFPRCGSKGTQAVHCECQQGGHKKCRKVAGVWERGGGSSHKEKKARGEGEKSKSLDGKKNRGECGCLKPGRTPPARGLHVGVQKEGLLEWGGGGSWKEFTPTCKGDKSSNITIPGARNNHGGCKGHGCGKV